MLFILNLLYGTLLNVLLCGIKFQLMNRKWARTYRCYKKHRLFSSLKCLFQWDTFLKNSHAVNEFINLLHSFNFDIVFQNRIGRCRLYFAWRSDPVQIIMQERKYMSVCYFPILADHRLLSLSFSPSCVILWCFRRRRDLQLM